MPGLDDAIAGLGGGGLALTLAVAALLGLRHATDPDHLTAVATLVLSEEDGRRRAGALGLCWGAGHAVTLTALGLPVVAFGDRVPAWLAQGAEMAIGVLIAGLALRLLVRWRRGTLHVHPHAHGDTVHAHPHVHEPLRGAEHLAADGDGGKLHGHDVAGHAHPHAERLGRSPRMAFGVGLMHGIGGSAGVGVLVVAGAGGPAAAAVSLLIFALATAGAMAAASALFARSVASAPLRRHTVALVPSLGVASLVFGGWYFLAALQPLV